jgi:hypothetical protein
VLALAVGGAGAGLGGARSLRQRIRSTGIFSEVPTTV